MKYQKIAKLITSISAMLGLLTEVSAQGTYNAALTVEADNGQGYVSSRVYLNSHNDYRGAGIFTLGQTNNWFFGNPYTDHPNSFMIGVGPSSTGWDQIAQKQYAKFYLNGNGNVGIGTTNPAYKLHVEGNLLSRSLGTSEIRLQSYAGGSSIATDWEIMTGHSSVGSVQNLAFWTNGSAKAVITNTGKFGIGTVSPTKELSVNGTIQAKEVIVETEWSDFVFEDSYRLRSLAEVESHIEKHGHLPDVPSASVVESEGLSLGEAQKIMMQKIEELTLYMIEKDKQVATLQDRVEFQQREIEILKSN